MVKILFVCLGNICRSPIGEGVFQHLINQNKKSHKYSVDSAGTCSHHIGEKPDMRMRETAKSHGIELKSRARQVIPSDFDNFDLILAMDRSNFDDLEKLAFNNKKSTQNLKLMREFDDTPENMNVPDPYYGGKEGFENVFNIVYRSTENLLDFLEEKV